MNINIITLAKILTFKEYSQALVMSLEELGHDVTFTTDAKNVGDVNIFTQSFQPYVPKTDGINILYQVEELWGQKDNYRVGNGYPYVLEMYEEQCKNMVDFGMNAHYCPLGYSYIYETDLPEVEEDIDMFFYGGVTKRRTDWINEIKSHPAMADKKIVHTDRREGVKKYFFGRERDELIMRSKLMLNFRAHDDWMYAPLKGLLTQCKKKMFFAEKTSGGYDPYEKNKHFIMFDGIDEFVEKANYWLDNHKERKEFAVNAYEDIKDNFRWSEFLDTALGSMGLC